MIVVEMPQLGESVAEGTLTKYMVKVGDYVKNGDAIAEVATDKADSEIFASADGVVTQLMVPEGETVDVGTGLIEIDETASPPAPGAAAPAKAEAPPAAPPSGPTVSGTSPSVRKLALENDVSLTHIEGTGEHGRITKDDVRRAMQGMSQPPLPPAVATSVIQRAPAPQARAPKASKKPAGDFPVANVGFGAFKVPPYIEKPGDEVLPFSRTRRLTADHMTYSKVVSPHVVTVAEVDLHKVQKLRGAHKAAYKAEGLSLTVLAFFCAATVKALRMYPQFNARVIEGALVQLKAVNLGIAVDSPKGLVVPNIKNADEFSLRGMARAIGDVAKRARANRLTADDFSGSSFSVTNPGIKGNLFGGAIIAQPNVGILRMGEIKKRVVVVSGPDGDQMAIHPVMYIALSYDHRVIDGVLGNEFLWTVANLLSEGDFTP